MRNSGTKKHYQKRRSNTKTKTNNKSKTMTKKNPFKKYKWISKGTCASHKYKDLTRKDCSKYFQKSNYRVTGSPHGPVGCWLVLGNSLKGAIKEEPDLKGKGFACWTKVKDGKKCSPDFPCVCK